MGCTTMQPEELDRVICNQFIRGLCSEDSRKFLLLGNIVSLQEALTSAKRLEGMEAPSNLVVKSEDEERLHAL